MNNYLSKLVSRNKVLTTFVVMLSLSPFQATACSERASSQHDFRAAWASMAKVISGEGNDLDLVANNLVTLWHRVYMYKDIQNEEVDRLNNRISYLEKDIANLNNRVDQLLLALKGDKK